MIVIGAECRSHFLVPLTDHEGDIWSMNERST